MVSMTHITCKLVPSIHLNPLNPFNTNGVLVVCANLSRVMVLNPYTIVEENHLQACQASFKFVNPHNTHSTYQSICV